MAFYTDKWTLVQKNREDLWLFRKSKNNLLMEDLANGGEVPERRILKSDILEEYDIAIRDKTSIYLLYQNTAGYLVLVTVDEDIREETILTDKAISEVFNLTIGLEDGAIHIIYNIRSMEDPDKYTINHHFNLGGKWYDYIISEVGAKLINSMKFLVQEGRAILLYYRNDREIVYREFHRDRLEWGGEELLAGGEGEKLFLDGIIIRGEIHFTYCQYLEESLLVKYGDQSISRPGSPAHPTMIYYRGKLWVSWLEMDQVASRYSEDMGKTWAKLHMWKRTKTMDFVRYKYLTLESGEDMNFDYSYGSIYPEIKFIGFGST
ncbi:MAG: hypothetical protein WCZ27_07405 [Tissierellaceae bacterium]